MRSKSSVVAAFLFVAMACLPGMSAAEDRMGKSQKPSTPASDSATEAYTVETRAVIRAITKDDGGLRTYVHLKVLPRAKLPFTTLRFHVRDPAILAGLADGSNVKFRAERTDGENTLTTIRAVPACVRFQPCD